jgi:hypothetical protein
MTKLAHPLLYIMHKTDLTRKKLAVAGTAILFVSMVFVAFRYEGECK